jgi:hypothetical protein
MSEIFLPAIRPEKIGTSMYTAEGNSWPERCWEDTFHETFPIIWIGKPAPALRVS